MTPFKAIFPGRTPSKAVVSTYFLPSLVLLSPIAGSPPLHVRNRTMLPTLFLHIDWPHVIESILSGGVLASVAWLFGRRQQKWREKTDTRTQDQKSIDQLLGRVTTLEGQMTAARADIKLGDQKIEDLRTEKMELQTQIVKLREDIALLEVKKAEFESREAVFQTQIAELRERLSAKSEQLRCAEEKLVELEKQREANRA